MWYLDGRHKTGSFLLKRTSVCSGVQRRCVHVKAPNSVGGCYDPQRRGIKSNKTVFKVTVCTNHLLENTESFTLGMTSHLNM